MLCLVQHSEEPLAILIINRDGLTPIAARSDVVNRAWIFDAKWSGHCQTIRLIGSECKMADLTPHFSCGFLS